METTPTAFMAAAVLAPLTVPAADTARTRVRAFVSDVGPRRLVRSGLLFLAVLGLLFSAWLLVLSDLPQARHQDGLERRFRSELALGVAPVNAPIAPGAPVAIVEIPSLDVRQVVVEGTRSQQLTTGPGHLRTSALPGQPGVSVLLGRRTTYGGPFSDLATMTAGDRIEVTTGQGITAYVVASVARHSEDDRAAFVADGDALLLVTSDPALFASGRLVVTAVPEGALHPSGLRAAQTAVGADELGLGSDGGAAVGLFVWLQLSIVATGIGLVLFRRWRRVPAWVLTAPVVAACAWRVCEQLSLLLPAAL